MTASLLLSAGLLLRGAAYVAAAAAAAAPPGYSAYPGHYCSATGGTRLFQTGSGAGPEECAMRCSSTPGCACFDFRPFTAKDGCRGVNRVDLKPSSNGLTAFRNSSSPQPPSPGPPGPPPSPVFLTRA